MKNVASYEQKSDDFHGSPEISQKYSFDPYFVFQMKIQL